MSDPITIGAKPAGNRRVLVLAAGAAVLIVMSLVLPGMLFGGGGSTASDAPVTNVAVPPASSGAPAPAAAPSTPAAPDVAAAAPVQSATARNPFVALSKLSGASTGSPVVAAVTQPEPAPTSIPNLVITDPLLTASPWDMPTEPDGTAAEPAPATPPANRVALLKVYTDPTNRLVASVRVNDVTYEAPAGEVFAFSYRVVSVDMKTRCADLLSGMERFSLCEGSETYR